jgi:hypothetical protein
MATRIIFNGQEYASTDVMPEEVRKAYQQALAQFADADQNGIPDILERGGPGNVIGVQHSSITVNGRTYESVDAMPALVRLLYQHAMGQVDANRTGLPASAAATLGLNTRSRAAAGDGSPQPDEVGSRTRVSKEPVSDDFMRALDRTGRSLERVIQVLLGIVAVVILPGAVFLMLKMDGGSRTQQRLYVAIAALVVLGAVDSQVQRLVRRRVPFSLQTTVEERRYNGVSLVLMLVAAVVLIGLALLLP